MAIECYICEKKFYEEKKIIMLKYKIIVIILENIEVLHIKYVI